MLFSPVLIAYMIHPKYSDKGIGMDPKDDEAARVYLVNINQENEAALLLQAYAPQYKQQQLVLRGKIITFDLIISELRWRLGMDNTESSMVQLS